MPKMTADRRRYALGKTHETAEELVRKLTKNGTKRRVDTPMRAIDRFVRQLEDPELFLCLLQARNPRVQHDLAEGQPRVNTVLTLLAVDNLWEIASRVINEMGYEEVLANRGADLLYGDWAKKRPGRKTAKHINTTAPKPGSPEWEAWKQISRVGP